jgi:hypothetical protein
MRKKEKIMNLEAQTAIDFWNGIDDLLDGIGESYGNWGGDKDPERIKEFRNGLSKKVGRKFTKIIKTLGTQQCVWGFIANGDGVHKGIPYFRGDVFKAAGWRAPAKHVRGSIFDTNNNWYSWTGPNYLI